MTSFFFANVKVYKRGATWPSGEPRMCVTCGVEQRRRRNQAILVANMGRKEAKHTLPVGYCKLHVPPELQEKVA